MVALMTTGCNSSEPAGQVIAVVDGVEVTTAELSEEARLRGVNPSHDRAARDALINELIERKLLVREAVRQKLDRTPRHQLTLRRLTDIALAQQLISMQASKAGDLSQESVSDFIASHPEAFAKRVLVSVEWVRVAKLEDSSLKHALAAAPSVDAMQNVLSKAALPVVRANETWDSARLPYGLNATKLKLHRGQTFVADASGSTMAGQVTAVVAQPVPKAQELDVARAWMERERAEHALRGLIERLRPAAKISYQKGYVPQRR